MALSHPSHSQGTIGSGTAPMAAPHGLYAITPDEPDTAALVARVTAILPHATWLQYRNKAASPRLRREQLLALRPPCRAHGVALIVNDDWRLAAELDVDGAHLGEDDDDLATARRALGDRAILGASCYDDLDRADRAVAAGAGYIAFGAFFASPTKPAARRATPALLRESARLRVPRVAIGGITPVNAPALVDAGADLVAVISGVFDAPDPAAAARAYAACFPPTLPSRTAEGNRRPSE